MPLGGHAGAVLSSPFHVTHGARHIHPRRAVLVQQVISIQYLRGFAALLVLVYHVGLLLPGSGVRFAIGGIGVDIFFVISGFIIWLTGRHLAPGEFVLRRLLRIVPLYWVVTLAVACGVVLTGGAVGLSELFHSLAFLAHPPADPNLPPKPVLSVGWTLNLEMLFYAVMLAALFAPLRFRLPIVAGVLSALLVAGTLIPAGADARLVFYTGEFLAAFLLGVGFGALWTSGRMPRMTRRNTLLFAAAVVLLGFLPLDGTSRLLAYGPPVALLVLFALMAEPGLRERPSAALHGLGDASYSIYLTHLPVIFGFQWLLAKGYLPFGGALLASAAVLAALAVGLACHYGFERPVHRALMARLAGRRVGTEPVYAP